MRELPGKVDFKTKLDQEIAGIKKLGEYGIMYRQIGSTAPASRSQNKVLPSIASTLRAIRESYPVPQEGGRVILETLINAFPYNERIDMGGKEMYGILYHGSPVPPEQMGVILKVSTPLWADAYGTYYEEGQPAISADELIDIPSTRALLHPSHPAIARARER